MKVISGFLKGRKIKGFDLDGTRPTMDRVKESLFAIIQTKIIESVCLDLFAGSGNLGIEAISQGAKKVYFNDYNKKAYSTIIKNIKNLDISECSTVMNNKYQKALEVLKNVQFDIIFLDPPYKTNYIEESIKLIKKNNLINKDGIIVCESDNIDKIIYDETFKLVKKKEYGDKLIVILKKV